MTFLSRHVFEGRRSPDDMNRLKRRRVATQQEPPLTRKNVKAGKKATGRRQLRSSALSANNLRRFYDFFDGVNQCG